MLLHNASLFKERRIRLVQATNMSVLLGAAFEQDGISFCQDNNFYYYTGVQEPGCFCLIGMDGYSTLFVPQYATQRSQWLANHLEVSDVTAKAYGFDKVVYLGEPCPSYTIAAYIRVADCFVLVKALEEIVQSKQRIGTLTSSYVLDRLFSFVSGVTHDTLHDVRPFIAAMRRIKDRTEIAAIYEAVETTATAHEAAAKAIKTGHNEAQVAAAVSYIFTETGATHAFPSIVASGAQATILHYHNNNKEMQSGELVVVDIGARLGQYCGDLTRTYPVSGKFSKRQKELYQAVLDTHEYIAALAQPGYWLRNNDCPEKSLHHLAVEFLRAKKLDTYFIHGIGHFLGLDVHDVGDGRLPLQAGDVITIEPGVYIPAEKIGIRIEDNYWITEDGSVCLSEHLPKDIIAIEKMVQENF